MCVIGSIGSPIVTFNVLQRETILAFNGLSQTVNITIPHTSIAALEAMQQAAGQNVTGFNGTYSVSVCLAFHLPVRPRSSYDTVVATCAYFDTARGEWTNRGCRALSSTDNLTVCGCDHLTDFSVFLPPNNLQIFVMPEIITTLGETNFVTLALLAAWVALYVVVMILIAVCTCGLWYHRSLRYIDNLAPFRITPQNLQSKSKVR